MYKNLFLSFKFSRTEQRTKPYYLLETAIKMWPKGRPLKRRDDYLHVRKTFRKIDCHIDGG